MPFFPNSSIYRVLTTVGIPSHVCSPFLSCLLFYFENSVISMKIGLIKVILFIYCLKNGRSQFTKETASLGGQNATKKNLSFGKMVWLTAKRASVDMVCGGMQSRSLPCHCLFLYLYFSLLISLS